MYRADQNRERSEAPPRNHHTQKKVLHDCSLIAIALADLLLPPHLSRSLRHLSSWLSETTSESFALLSSAPSTDISLTPLVETMSGPPSTLRTHAPPDPATQSLHEDVAPSLQQLIRLQIFTPLTLLLALGAQLVTTFAVHPNIGQISDDYITIWTARKEFIGGYLLLVSLCTVEWV